MKNFLFFILAITVLIVVGGIFLNQVSQERKGSKEPPPAITSYEYFWSKTCPHCAKVAEFMEGWSSKDKIDMVKFEVNESSYNANLFLQRGQYCKIPKTELGVPLLITPDGKCINGDEPIIEHFKSLEL